MKLSRTFSVNPGLFGLVPLVNVIFLLLIFFALTSSFILQPGIAVTLPFSSYNLAPQHNPQIVSITGTPAAIYFHDQKVSIEELARSLSEASAKQRTVIVRADKNAPYDLVVQVTNQGLQLGFSVVLATGKEP